MQWSPPNVIAAMTCRNSRQTCASAALPPANCCAESTSKTRTPTPFWTQRCPRLLASPRTTGSTTAGALWAALTTNAGTCWACDGDFLFHERLSFSAGGITARSMCARLVVQAEGIPHVDILTSIRPETYPEAVLATRTLNNSTFTERSWT